MRVHIPIQICIPGSIYLSLKQSSSKNVLSNRIFIIINNVISRTQLHDQHVCDELVKYETNCVIPNHRNTLGHRMALNIRRAAARKEKRDRKQGANEELTRVQEEIEECEEQRSKAQATMNEHKERTKALKQLEKELRQTFGVKKARKPKQSNTDTAPVQEEPGTGTSFISPPVNIAPHEIPPPQVHEEHTLQPLVSIPAPSEPDMALLPSDRTTTAGLDDFSLYSEAQNPSYQWPSQVPSFSTSETGPNAFTTSSYFSSPGHSQWTAGTSSLETHTGTLQHHSAVYPGYFHSSWSSVHPQNHPEFMQGSSSTPQQPHSSYNGWNPHLNSNSSDYYGHHNYR